MGSCTEVQLVYLELMLNQVPNNGSRHLVLLMDLLDFYSQYMCYHNKGTLNSNKIGLWKMESLQILDNMPLYHQDPDRMNSYIPYYS